MPTATAAKSISKPSEAAVERPSSKSPERPLEKTNEKMAVFTVRPARDEHSKDYWTEIGTMFPHERGDGFTILLNALPLDAKLVVLPRKERPEQA